ncbi:hypothetical protein AAC387_Pa09g2251 [Persea americana]
MAAHSRDGLKVSMRALELLPDHHDMDSRRCNTPRVYMHLICPARTRDAQMQPLTCSSSKPRQVIPLYRISPKGNLVIPFPPFPLASKQRRKQNPSSRTAEPAKEKRFLLHLTLPKRRSSSFRNRYLECFVNTAFLLLFGSFSSLVQIWSCDFSILKTVRFLTFLPPLSAMAIL